MMNDLTITLSGGGHDHIQSYWFAIHECSGDGLRVDDMHDRHG